MDPDGTFYIAKAIRPLLPYETRLIPICFKPNVQENFSNLLEIISGLTLVRVRLIGQGIRPNAIPSSGSHLHFGDVCVGDVSTKELELFNPSKIPMIYRLELISSDASKEGLSGSQNFSGIASFSLTTHRFKIGGESSLKVPILFAPDREHDNFFDFLSICYDGQSDPTIIKLSGNGWESSSCILDSIQLPTP